MYLTWCVQHSVNSSLSFYWLKYHLIRPNFWSHAFNSAVATFSWANAYLIWCPNNDVNVYEIVTVTTESSEKNCGWEFAPNFCCLATSLPSPSIITYHEACKVASHIAMKAWQRKWNQETSGCYTRECLCLKLGQRFVTPKVVIIAISYCRLLLNDTMLNDGSYHGGTCDNLACECGMDGE